MAYHRVVTGDVTSNTHIAVTFHGSVRRGVRRRVGVGVRHPHAGYQRDFLGRCRTGSKDPGPLTWRREDQSIVLPRQDTDTLRITLRDASK